MCLILEKDSIETITYTDIVVYKVVERVRMRIPTTKQSDILYRSPYYRFDYQTNLIYCGLLSLFHDVYSGDRTIENGFHSYARLEDAKRNAGPIGIVVKCIIPTGAKFYKGKGIDLTPQYASNRIMIKEEV